MMNIIERLYICTLLHSLPMQPEKGRDQMPQMIEIRLSGRGALRA